MSERFFELVSGLQRDYGAYVSKFMIRRKFRTPPAAFEDISFLSTQQISSYHANRGLILAIVNLGLVYAFQFFREWQTPYIILCVFIHFGSKIYVWMSHASVYFSAKLVPDDSAETSRSARKFLDFDNIEMYQHDMSLDATGFRCLLLKRSTDETSPIECVLHSFTITTPALHYEALSYSWGPTSSEGEQQYILCHGKKLAVSENCISALYHLRQKYRDRLLWIDAICIDQTSIEDKNQQLQVMGSIYEKAAKVIVWLGPSTAESRLAFRYLAFNLQLSWLPKFFSSWIIERLFNKIRSRRHDDIILGLNHKSWFSRMWTIQEVALAQQGVCEFVCGQDTANYDYANAELWIMAGNLTVSSAYPLNEMLYHQSSNILRAELRTRVLFNKPISTKSLADLMRYLAMFDATDPKDKIFGLYGVLEKLGFAMPKADYRDSIDYIYWQAIVIIIRMEPSLLFLSLASGVGSQIPLAPSWVPDFRKINSFMCMDGQFHSTNESTPILAVKSRGYELHVSGTVIDRIADYSTQKVWEPPFGTREVSDHRYFGLDDVEKFFPTIKVLQHRVGLAIAKGSRTKEKYGNNYEAILQVLTMGQLPLMSCDSQDFSQFLHLLFRSFDWFANGTTVDINPYLDKARNDPEMKARYFDNPTYAPFVENPEWMTMCAMKADPNVARVLHLVWAVARGNTVFETRSGWLGLATHALREDDVLVLLQGMRMPAVLRPVLGTGERKFMFVGTAYVHGMMKGELWDEGERREDLILV